jgi:Tfp pilus assembly protein PilX
VRFSALRARLRCERGAAVPVALMTIIVGLGLGSAALVATQRSQSGATRDSHVKRAIAAADAGMERAVYRENKILTTTTLPCVIVNTVEALVPGPPDGDGWCPPVTRTIGGNSYTYQVKPWIPVTLNGHEGREVTIVSTGTAGGVSRRIAEVAFAPLGSSVFGTEGAIGANGITMAGSTLIDASAGTNGGFSFTGSPPIVCGDMRHGPGGAVPSGHQCSGYDVTEGTIVLPPPYWNPSNHDDVDRFFAPNPPNGDLSKADTKIGNVTWDPNNSRTLTLTGGAVLTMGGQNYMICKLKMTGASTLIMAANTKVKIFFDKPENCGMSNGATQVDISGGSKILSTSYNPDTDNFDLPGLYLMGSESLSTNVTISGNGAEGGEFVLYAPLSDVTLTGTAVAGYTTFVGAVAGKTLTLNGRARIAKEASAPSPDIPTVLLYGRQRYVECTGATGTPNPDSNC